MFTTVRVIHYGSASFDPARFSKPTHSDGINKPRGGYWCSPINSKYGWREWVRDNMDEWQTDVHHTATIRGNGLIINKREDYTGPFASRGSSEQWDWDWIIAHYDFIWLTYEGECDCHMSLYGWDCESIVVLNPAAITAD